MAKKQSKNLGVKKPCPGCTKVLASAIKIPAIPPIEISTKCKHCDELIEICIGHKPFITARKVKIGLLILIIIGAYQFADLTKIKAGVVAMIDHISK